MKLAVIFNDKKLSGKLTKLVTGCYAYHVAWVDESGGKMYDMHWIRRRRNWPYYSSGEVLLFDFPEVTKEYLEHKLDTDKQTYGWKDYVLFGLRPIYHLFGKSTRNVGGVICSEMTNDDARACGVDTPWKPHLAPPSPCDWYHWLLGSGRQMS